MKNPLIDMKNPWPEIRRKRINELLPKAMEYADVDTWVIICRENANDPLAKHVGGENAGRPLAILFEKKDKEVHSVAFSPWGEVVGLRDMAVHKEIIALEDPSTIYDDLAARLRQINPKNIALNSAEKNIADGLSYTQRQDIEKALGSDLSSKIISAESLVSEWLSIKTEEEVEIMRQAGELTVKIQLDAYSKIIPGKTTDAEVASYIRKKMDELKVGDAWSENHNPAVNSGVARGHAGASDKVINYGDFIQTDFGIKVFDTWCTDYQRFAYVLPKGKTKVPEEDLFKWEVAVKGHRIALAAMKPGVSGYEVDSAQREWMKESGSKQVRWGTGHPVGFFAHDIGPALTGGQRDVPPKDSLRLLRPGQTFAFDGFFAWDTPEGERLISVEEMAVVTESGAKYLIKPQDDLFLIK
jgi:Xaa-Pro aminopeptidase